MSCFKKNNYQKSLLYKLILNNKIIHFGASCDNKLNKVLYREKTNIKKNKHKIDNVKEFFKINKDSVDKIEIKLIKCIACNNKNDLTKILKEYIDENKQLLFVET